MEKAIKIIRYFSISLILTFILYLFYKDFVPTGKLVLRQDFKRKTVLISDLYPKVRVRNRNIITIDPVYFDILIPRMFEKIKIKIKYENKEQDFFQVGIRNVFADWEFAFKTFEDRGKKILPEIENGYKVASAEFDFYPFFVKDRKVYFILSAPSLYLNQREIEIKEIEVILEREPWTRENFFPRLKNYFRRVLKI